MSGKPKVFWRIKALLFTGAIAAASLRGCTYGPPVEPAMTKQNIVKQNVDTSVSNSHTSPIYDNYNLEEKSEPTKNL